LHFDDEEIVELTYAIMWYTGVHRVNAIFDLEPPLPAGETWTFGPSAE